jgi:hypothetical protein
VGGIVLSEAAGPGAALARAAELLEAGNPEEAAHAMAEAAEACATVGQLTPEAIADVRNLFERCQRAEADLRRKVVEALGHAAGGRRAQDVYGK